MAEPASDQPTLLHRVEFGLFRSVEWLVARMPMDSCAVFGRRIGRLFQFASRRYRLLIRRNLRIATALNPPDRETLDRLVDETFRRAGANFVSSLRSATMPPEELAEHIEAVGCGLLSRSEDGNGLIVTMPHMGNWEIMTKLSGLHAGVSRFGGVYRPLDNPLMDRLTHTRRTADGCQLFSRRDGFHAPIALLRSPGPLGVLADQRAGGQGVVLPFFGKLTSCTPLPDLMARRAKADVATLSIATTAHGRWRAEMVPLGKSPGVAGIIGALEQAMRRSLADVFWFHDRWRTDRTRPLSFYTRFDPAVAARAEVPMRVILTVPDSADADAASALVGALLDQRPDLRIEWLTSGGTSHPDPRVIVHHWDRSAPDEHADGLFSRIDASHPAPIDAVLLFGGSQAMARVAKRAGIRAIIGCGVRGRPWTRSFRTPEKREDWLAIAEALAEVPNPKKA